MKWIEKLSILEDKVDILFPFFPVNAPKNLWILCINKHHNNTLTGGPKANQLGT